jgi:ribosomal protein S18 acetylase RimI-like enzyme
VVAADVQEVHRRGDADLRQARRPDHRLTTLAATLRDYDASRDVAAVRACFVALQEFERALDAAAPRGEAIADAYLDRMFGRCITWAGRVFVAEHEANVVGFVCVWGRVPPQEPDEPQRDYAYVSDLVVLPAFRRHGIGRALLARAEDYARSLGVETIGIGVMAENRTALDLYEADGYRATHLELRKPLA